LRIFLLLTTETSIVRPSLCWHSGNWEGRDKTILQHCWKCYSGLLKGPPETPEAAYWCQWRIFRRIFFAPECKHTVSLGTFQRYVVLWLCACRSTLQICPKKFLNPRELWQICEVPATITRFEKKKLVFSRKTVQVIKILHVKVQEDPFSSSQVFLCEGRDQLTDKTKLIPSEILSKRPTNTRYFLFDLE
jgi:hypothetical protein